MLNEYLTLLSSLRTGGGKSNPKPHKICMMLAISDLIASKNITHNRIPNIRTNEVLKRQFTLWFDRLASSADKNTPDNPFFHLVSEGFWHLKVSSGAVYSNTLTGESKSKVMNEVEYAYLDDELFEYFKNPFTRTLLNDALLTNLAATSIDVSNKLSFESWLTNLGKSKRTVKHYSGALESKLATIAEREGIYHSSLLNIDDLTEFNRVEIGLRQLHEFVDMDSRGNNMYGASLNAYAKFLKSNSAVTDDLDEIIASPTLSETEKVVLSKARTGQGIYRNNLIKYWKGRCAVTGYANPRLLIASHIKPWKKSDNEERIDFYNGLLLSPNLDKTFDLGYISFTDSGKIIMSTQLEKPELLGIHPAMKVELAPNHLEYLKFHRETYEL